ncbi:hypothetical protein BU25DRAFT_382057 [Macroventuria anomochaeta]|uniref:Uncharacterized protein n=1 Tax=Macroventuria anomochaeta TaxID=301207 RepID=A0ACB6SEW9_9PLEO|nr:uncharacterized protein BU25DRAFT_382057 [Macroventuria anomochaeta]KAF2632538.1 hypothetical protein BU25DRAFT_382057 [Macroventuria anomochaeta]
MAGSTSPSIATKSKTLRTTITHVPSWPEEARALKKHTWLSYFFGFGDVILLLLPVYFLRKFLGIAVLTLNGKPTKDSSFGNDVEFAMSLGPTMFPIIFAAVSGRSMKMIARYLAERGSKLSTLELLMASQSVWGTIESQMIMQRLTIVGANLLFLWALSPLGGQASLRLMRRHNEGSPSSLKLRYMTTGPGGTIWGLSSTYVGDGKFADANALYTAALLAPLSTKTGARDSWGNVKIPNLENLNVNISDAQGWIEVPSAQVPETYSSLVGLPIVGLPLSGKSNFTIESTYLTVECAPFSQAPYPGVGDSTNNGKTTFTRLDELLPYPGQVWLNKSRNNPFEPAKGRRASFFLDTNLGSPWAPEDPDFDLLVGRLDGFVGHYNDTRLSDTESKTKREIVFTSMYATSVDSGEYGLNIARCTLAQNHVESMIVCTGDQCAAQKIRTSTTDTRPSALTSFEHGLIMQNFAQQFPIAVQFNTGSSPTERFLSNTSAFPFIQQAGHLTEDVAYSNLSLLTSAVFSRRLSLLFNTYYQLTIQPTGYFGSLSSNLTLYGPDTLPVTDVNVYLPSNFSATNNSFFDWYSTFDTGVQSSKSPFIGATIEAHNTTTQEIFLCNFAWFAILIVASTVIFITGAAGLILKRKTLGPDMFGFVTSMTYENPWVNIPKGGTMLDAMERARLLKDMEVHVGNVRGDEDTGHIAFAAGVPLRKLERGRLYC